MKINPETWKEAKRLPRSCNLQDVRLYHNRYLAVLLLGTRWR